MEEICKICQQDGAAKSEFKNLSTHLRAKHKITRKEYDALGLETEELGEISEEEFEEIEEPTEETKVESEFKEEVLGNIFKKESDELENMTLKEVSKRYGLSPREVVNLIKKFKKGDNLIDLTAVIESNLKSGKKDATSLKDQSHVETESLYIAEALTKDHGFECLTVRSGPPKTWVLEKR